MKSRSSVRSARAIVPASLVCIICLLIPGSAALSQPFQSFMLDSSLTHMPGFDNVGGTRVAFGPDVGLVVWTTETHVRGVRVDRHGTLLDTVQIDIDGPDLNDPVYSRPGVAWSGQNFLVVWANWDVTRCALVQPDGQVTARAILQDSVQTGQREASVAFDGTNFLASWIAQYDTLGLTAFYSRVSPQGLVLDNPPRMVAPLAAGRQYGIGLYFHDDRYLAVWNDWDTIGISGNFVLPDGSITDSAGFRIRRGVIADCPAVTHDRTNFLVSWYDGGDRTKMARVTDSGVVLDTAGVLIDSFSSVTTALLSNGDTTLFLFRRDSLYDRDSLTLVAVRVDATLNRLDAEPVKLSAPGYAGYGYAAEYPAAALCGDDYFITWTQPLARDPVEDWPQALCRRMNRAGEILDSTPAVLSYGVNQQTCPDVASDGENFLAVWADTRRDSRAQIYDQVEGSRFTADGTRLDPSPIPLGNALHEVPPAVAFGGGCYLVTWKDSSGICAKRITTAGIVLDSAPLLMPDPYYTRPFTDVAFGDSFFLMAWAGASGLLGCRVSPAGAILDTAPLQLAVNPYDSRFPRVAFDGDNFLVARRDGDDMHRCVRVSQNGAILDTGDILLGPAAYNYHGWDMPEVAYGHSIYFAVDDFTASWCWRLTPSGKPFDSVPVANLQFAHVVFDGTDFMLLCQSRDSTGNLTDTLGAIRITPEGRVLDSTPFSLVTADRAASSAQQAAMCTNEAQRVGVVFTGYESVPDFASRIRAATFPAIVGIGSQREVGQPVAFRVLPNPASRSASLSFNVDQTGPVQVAAFDVTGRRSASLFSGRMKAGQQSLSLDTRRLANGVYFIRLGAGEETRSTRLVISH